MKGRVKQNKESLPELAQSVRRLVSEAYSTAPYDVQMALAKDYFVDALLDSEIRWKICETRPKSLDKALRVAVELEAFRKAEQQRRPNRVVRGLSLNPEDKSSQSTDMSQMKTQVENLSELVEQLMKRQMRYKSRQSAERRSGPRDTPDKKRVCWICGKEGHWANQCRRKDLTPYQYFYENTKASDLGKENESLN